MFNMTQANSAMSSVGEGLSRLGAIIVCFYPDAEKLSRLISVLAEAVDVVILFNNGGLDETSLPVVGNRLRVEAHGGRNLGLALALNLACEVAWADGCRYVVTFDQDSLPERSMISILLAELQVWQERTPKVAAIGPQLLDVRSSSVRTSAFVQTSRLSGGSIVEAETQPVALLITSGCLIDLKVWATVAKFDDRLFIDYVDLNWCWRLARQGYIVLGTTKTRMQHELSKGLKQLGPLTLTKYGPVRRYFQCRNAVYHLLYERLPPGARRFIFKNLLTTVIASVFADEAVGESLSHCWRGVVDGARKKLGPFRT